MSMIERVAKAILRDYIPHIDAWELADESDRSRCRGYARAAIAAMRDPPVSVQVGAMEAILQDVIDNDGPVKPQEDCKTASDWMDRGYSLGKRMLSGHDVTVCFNGAIDHILKDEA